MYTGQEIIGLSLFIKLCNIDPPPGWHTSPMSVSLKSTSVEESHHIVFIFFNSVM